MLLAHRRVSIIDLSKAGHQPMPDHDKQLWIVYNGEIYNYRELRKELEIGGYHFQSQTDTEVILAAYEKWGNGCVHKFNGMWAFVIYDRRRNVIFASRDRSGVKPLYYFYNKEKFAFASEIKALLSLPFIPKEINRAAVFDFLALELEEQEEEGFIRSIFELPPAHCFELDLNTGDFRKWRYYQLKFEDAWEKVNDQKLKVYLSDIKELIINAIKLRLRSDVAVGSSLSGGIDSSSIVCVINDLLRKEKIQQIGDVQKTFSACYNDSLIDESRWAKLIVDQTKTAWHRT
ncbi:MAG: asparagine synthase (glutamine-hydrolyzing), partial [Omnitrophica WOR_2 bacterium GWA2_47_8]